MNWLSSAGKTNGLIITSMYSLRVPVHQKSDTGCHIRLESRCHHGCLSYWGSKREFTSELLQAEGRT